jgi:prepilin-type N-terminal cleavage/methylation domain-containing protein
MVSRRHHLARFGASRLDGPDRQGQQVKTTLARYARSQGGFTLVEVLVASALGLVVMTALAQVVLTTWRAGITATSRIEASGQIRNVQLRAYDDFALSNVPIPAGCAATAASPCTTQPIDLGGVQASNSINPATSPFGVTYTWDGVSLLQRQVGGNPPSAVATGVSKFSWYLDGSAPHQTVVVTISITVQSYTQIQTLRFYPRVNP